MTSVLLTRVRNIRTLGRAWTVISENGRSSRSLTTRYETKEFGKDAVAKLTKIQRQLCRNAFKFRPAIGVEARKPGKSKTRPIVIAPIESRIVQRAIHDVLLTLPSIRQFAENPYSFGGVRKQAGKPLAAVPGAISAVLEAIGNGATYVIRCDISSFFTRIQKSTVASMVASAVNDPEFMKLFDQATAVELENVASLREQSQFPIHEIGVAQGNSLSPLLGNILLSEFDKEMNIGPCRCIRYIDDFIILAPDRRTAEPHFARAREILAKHGLEVSSDKEKSFKGFVTETFIFLGIEMANGAIRPSAKSRRHLIDSITEILGDSAKALRTHGRAGTAIQSLSFLHTLNQIRGIVQGWGHHYAFCNEKNILHQLDVQINDLIRHYIGTYAKAQRKADERGRRRLLGVPLLEEFAAKPFEWPKSRLTQTLPGEIPSRAPSGLSIAHRT